MKAGIAKANITPAVGSLGHKGPPAIIEGIASELYAKALVLDDGTTKAAIITADVILFGKKVVAEIRERIEKLTGISGRNVMLAASHTHSGTRATMRERWSVYEPDHSYLDQLVAKISGTALEANSQLEEVRIGAGQGHAAVNINRWIPTPDGPKGARWAPNPEGAVDDALSVLRVDAVNGQPIAAFVNYAAHPSVMRWDKDVSADFPGFLQSVMEKTYGHQLSVLFANGASGDTKIKWLVKKEDGSFDFGYGDAEDARRWGTVLAGEAIKVYEQVEPEDVKALSISSRKVELPLLPHPSIASVEAAIKEKQAQSEDTDWEERTLAALREGTAPTSIAGEVQLLRLGPDIALVAVPGELFAEVGLKMKKDLACTHPFIVGYANGYAGYLPSAASCREDGADRIRYDWHKFFWYPSNFSEDVESILLAAARELAGQASQC